MAAIVFFLAALKTGFNAVLLGNNRVLKGRGDACVCVLMGLEMVEVLPIVDLQGRDMFANAPTKCAFIFLVLLRSTHLFHHSRKKKPSETAKSREGKGKRERKRGRQTGGSNGALGHTKRKMGFQC